ncbi:hypothetical protein M3484_16275 [Pseudomonas sp. GX19020]|uniref:hypothetical protein n=1 Tax=Pseudomonas sp. GX19020 TaxID=2942277 RepID=UPI002018CC5B|nr:hypothetical protein [Pseudomonas sp. GX19020]MCL4068128.1 hypothetical protein [Pseudomonas sp. GX19020]
MREKSVTPLFVFERGMAAEIEAGGQVELIARGPKGSKAVEGWYIMLSKSGGGGMLVMNSNEATIKFLKTIAGVFKLLERLPAREVKVPLEGQVESEAELLALHVARNSATIGDSASAN